MGTQTMTPATVEEVRSRLQKWGRLKSRDVPWESPVLAAILDPRRVTVSSSPTPFEGGRWRHFCGPIEYSLGDVPDAAGLAADPLRTLRRRRQGHLAQLLAAFAADFLAQTDGDPANYRVVQLQGEWLYESVQRVGSHAVVFVESTYAFEPLHAGTART